MEKLLDYNKAKPIQKIFRVSMEPLSFMKWIKGKIKGVPL